MRLPVLVAGTQSALGKHPLQMMGGGHGGVHQRDARAHKLPDHAFQQRVVGAAQNQGIYSGFAHLGQVLGNDQLRDLLLFGFAVIHIPGLHQRYKQRAGTGSDLHPGYQLPQQLFVAAGADGGGCANDADAAVTGDKGSLPGGGIHYAKVGHRQLGCLRSRVGAAHRAAGGHDALDVFGKQKGHVLPGVLQNGLRAAAAVGHPTGIAEVDDILMGQALAQLPHAGQAAQTAVEHTDGAIIHAAFPSFPPPVRSGGR